MKALRTLLAHPLTRHLDIDDPNTTQIRRQIISQNEFLRRIYQEWYQAIEAALPEGTEPVLEIGAGPGFMGKYVPALISSEIFPCPQVHLVLNAQQLPFAAGSLRGVVMTNVLHHLPSSRKFFKEATRCVQPKGRLVMIEPWVTGWSKFIYRYFHHEPFHISDMDWELGEGGNLSNANSALPWIIFERDRGIFEREFNAWQIISIQPGMPFRYLLSGGVSMRALMPGFTFAGWRGLEKMLSPWMNHLAMFCMIVIEHK